MSSVIEIDTCKEKNNIKTKYSKINQINQINIDKLTNKKNNENQKNNENKKNNENQKNNENHNNITQNNIFDYISYVKYKVPEIKALLKQHKLKTSGTKKILILRLINYLKKVNAKEILLNLVKQYLFKRYIKCKGPALIKRDLCVNSTDFYTFQSIRDISFNEFISYTDSNNITYGFNIVSLYNLLVKSANKENPYDRKTIPVSVIKNIKHLLKYSKKYNNKIDIHIEKDALLDKHERLKLKAIELFQEINILGNNVNYEWFWNLSLTKTKLFIKTLWQLWVRLRLTSDVKYKICPNHKRLFDRYLTFYDYTLYDIKKLACKYIEHLIKTGEDIEYKKLGASYILCSLTYVSENAANAFPWLYDAVFNINEPV